MSAMPTCDDELLSDTSAMTVQERQQVSWRKPLAVSTCAALVFAAIVVFKPIPAGLGEVAQDELIDLQEDGCSSDTENCMASKCCKIKGRKCFMKNEYWANCNEDCNTSYIDDWDKENNITDGWNCTELKPQAKDVCAKDNVDCTSAGKCCTDNFVCYIKNEWWRNCNEGCETTAGANTFEHGDFKADSWSCEIHDLGSYCPDLGETSTPADQYKCCQSKFCTDQKFKKDDYKECNKSKCAFYANTLNPAPPGPPPPPRM